MRILSVDDKPDNRYLIETTGRASGHQVVSAENGIEALRELRNGPFDLIVSDILMPEMDGFRLCREVKQNEAFRHIPFVFYTATYTSRKDEELGL
jgi:CheY-like chemotaxis protein